MLLLETSRGCRYRCRFCYYWKSYDAVYQLSNDNIRASLRHAAQRGAREVFLLDPTLNQRRDFADLLRLLAEGNPGRRFSYFDELRGEGVTEETARLLRQANFTEVEVGLQSVEPDAMTLMDRKNNLRAFERGVRAMMGQSIRVKVDLIVGLPGDSVASVRRGLHYLRDNGLCSDLQVFNLAVLPGTAFREQAGELGLVYQPRPPYYVLKTPRLERADLFGLIHEAQEEFGIEFDALPPPLLDFDATGDRDRLWCIDLDRGDRPAPPPARRRSQAFTLWLRSADFGRQDREPAGLVRELLADNPFSTLQVVLEPTGRSVPGPGWLEELFAACQEGPTYLDRFYALQPGRAAGSRRLLVLLDGGRRDRLADWNDAVAGVATVVWRGPAGERELEAHEYQVAGWSACSDVEIDTDRPCGTRVAQK
jgi:MoaA/NifB/PqqE/SkfB family radical SAM enzyme